MQLRKPPPCFETAWLAASERSAGKTYQSAVHWRLKTPIPGAVAAMKIAPAAPAGAPRLIFSALDSPVAADLEPKFATAGHAVISNSSAFRMQADVPLVIPEVNPDHVRLLETQPWRRESNGFLVTNPNCSTTGLVLALAPLHHQFGVEKVFVVTMQAISGAGYPGVASLNMLGDVIPYISQSETQIDFDL